MVQRENNRILLKDIKQDLVNWNSILYFPMGELFIKILILPKFSTVFSENPIGKRRNPNLNWELPMCLPRLNAS